MKKQQVKLQTVTAGNLANVYEHPEFGGVTSYVEEELKKLQRENSVSLLRLLGYNYVPYFETKISGIKDDARNYITDILLLLPNKPTVFFTNGLSVYSGSKNGYTTFHTEERLTEEDKEIITEKYNGVINKDGSIGLSFYQRDFEKAVIYTDYIKNCTEHTEIIRHNQEVDRWQAKEIAKNEALQKEQAKKLIEKAIQTLFSWVVFKYNGESWQYLGLFNKESDAHAIETKEKGSIYLIEKVVGASERTAKKMVRSINRD